MRLINLRSKKKKKDARRQTVLLIFAIHFRKRKVLFATIFFTETLQK